MEENQDLNKAVKWWRSLSYNEQDALIRKYIAESGFYFRLAQAGKISNIQLLDMMTKEGVV